MLSLIPSEVLRKSTRLPVMKAAVLSFWGIVGGGHKDTKNVTAPRKVGRTTQKIHFPQAGGGREPQQSFPRAGGKTVSKIKFPHGQSFIFYWVWSHVPAGF